jgi:hypothetical protein
MVVIIFIAPSLPSHPVPNCMISYRDRVDFWRRAMCVYEILFPHYIFSSRRNRRMKSGLFISLAVYIQNKLNTYNYTRKCFLRIYQIYVSFVLSRNKIATLKRIAET